LKKKSALLVAEPAFFQAALGAGEQTTSSFEGRHVLLTDSKWLYTRAGQLVMILGCDAFSWSIENTPESTPPLNMAMSLRNPERLLAAALPNSRTEEFN